MRFRVPYARALLASAAVTAAIVLAGCEAEVVDSANKALKPLSPEMTAELQKKNMPKESPILVRLFKEEAEMEVWKQDNTGHFELLKTYPVCRWSGELGPKIKEGDRQAPEGFYTITKAQMNPNSAYYLSFDMGYPNAFDRALGRTGSNLMVHGDCSSRGCYAMTDEQIGEIYALAREAFFGGQRSFQVQAYPFHMTPVNFAKHRNNPNLAFWKMLKQGNDHFEVTHLAPKVDVCEKHYVFDADAPAGSNATLHFNPAGTCPAYEIPKDIADAVAEKNQRDEIQTAELIRSGTPMAPIRTGADGGMNQVFLAKLRPNELRDSDGSVRMIFDSPGAPGTIPPTVNPPRVVQAVATASDSPGQSNNVLTSLFRVNGEDQKPAPLPVSQVVSAPTPRPRPAVNSVIATPVPAPRAVAVAAHPAKPAPKTAAPVPVVAQHQPTPPAANPQPAQAVAAAASPSPLTPPIHTTAAIPGDGSRLLNGAQPTLPSGSFESRWSALQ